MNGRLSMIIALAMAISAAGCASSQAARETLAAADEGPVTCRETLVHNSNTHQTVCLSAAGWERYEKAQGAASRELVRSLQGSYAGF